MVTSYPRAFRAHCSTYTAIVGNVRAGNGVGIVPLWYWKLDRLRDRGCLFYSRLAGMPRHFLTAYLPPTEDEDRSGEGRLSPPAKALFNLIEQAVWNLGMKGAAAETAVQFST